MTAFTDLLSSKDADRRFLAVLEPRNTATNTPVALYFSSHGFVSKPTDVPANTYYMPRINTALSLERSMTERGRLFGRTIPSFGYIALNNADGELDDLEDYAWGGHRVRVYMGGPDFALADYGLIFDGTSSGFETSDDEFRVNIRDLQYTLDKELQPAKFLGTGGVEGTDDLTDQRKPRAYGVVRNISPIYLGIVSGKHTFAVGDGPIVGVLRVLDNGVALAFTTSATPTAGQWTVDVATGRITLGGSYVGPLTADVIGTRYLSVTSTTSTVVGTGSKVFTVPSGQGLPVGAAVRIMRTAAPTATWMDGAVTAYTGTSLTINVTSIFGTGTFTDWTISPWGTTAGAMKAIATSLGVTSFDATSLTNLDNEQPATIGLWLPDGGNGLQILDQFAAGAGVSYGFTRAGLFQAKRVIGPASSLASYSDIELLDIDREATDEPAYEVTVRYRRNWTVMSGDQLAGATTDADRAFLTKEWRQVASSDAAVLADYPLASEIEIDSLFDTTAAAANEAARQLALFGVRRDYFTVRLKAQPLSRDIGDTITITRARYGLDAGKNLVVVDLTEDMTVAETEVGLWG